MDEFGFVDDIENSSYISELCAGVSVNGLVAQIHEIKVFDVQEEEEESNGHGHSHGENGNDDEHNHAHEVINEETPVGLELILKNAHGLVSLIVEQQLKVKLKEGMVIRINNAFVHNENNGCLALRLENQFIDEAIEIIPMDKLKEKDEEEFEIMTDELTLPEKVCQSSLSEVHRLYGLIIVRADKILLVKSKDWDDHYTFPAGYAVSEDTERSAALKNACSLINIDPTQVYLLHALPPVVQFNPIIIDNSDSEMKSLATLYIAYAKDPPPTTATTEIDEEEGIKEKEEEDDAISYEWFTYEESMKSLSTVFERQALNMATVNLHNAYAANIVEPNFDKKFGDSLLNMEEPTKSTLLKNEEEEEIVLERKIPVTILSGFLGAGKTTLLKHLIKNKSDKRIALIVNDMAELNVDANIISPLVEVFQKDDKESTDYVVELSNGCICCTLREDLLKQIVDISLSPKKYDYLIIESTGVSEPLQVAETFTFETSPINNKSMYLSDIAQLDTMVTVIDSSSFFYDLNENKHDLSQLLIEQVEFANVIILNKMDLVDENTINDLTGFIKKLNPNAFIYKTTNSELDSINQVMNTNLFNFEEARKNPGWLKELRGTHIPETEEYGISSFIYKKRLPFHPVKLSKLINDKESSLNKLILRSKGVCWINSFHGVDFSIEWAQAGHRFAFRYGNPWLVTLEESERPPNAEVLIKNHPYGDRLQEIVLIGQDLNEGNHKQLLIDELDACLISPSNEEDADILSPIEVQSEENVLNITFQ